MRLMVSSFIVSASSSLGCGEAYVEESVASSEEPVWGGTETQARGVVALGMGCTGILINNRTILTAAHCVPNVPAGQVHHVWMSAVYKHPTLGPVCLSGGGVSTAPDTNPWCTSGGTPMYVSVYSTYGDGHTNSDIAVIYSASAFSNVSSADFSFIDVDTFSTVSRMKSSVTA